MKKLEIIMVCNKCGKPCEIDEEKTTKNWRHYKPCECGGMAVPRLKSEINTNIRGEEK